MRLLLFLVLLSMIGGCATIKVADYTESKVIDDPEIGITITRGLGERIVAKGVRITGPAIEIVDATQFNKSEGESSIMTCALTVWPTSVFKRGVYSWDNIRADCFGPVDIYPTLSDGTTNWNCTGRMFTGDICQDNNGNFFLLAGLGIKVYLEQDFDHIKLVEKVERSNDNFVQEMLYNGRLGNSLKFIYREFSDDLIRPAFSQEVQYDLSQSSIIGFRSLRIKIINASNTSIQYQLLSNF